MRAMSKRSSLFEAGDAAYLKKLDELKANLVTVKKFLTLPTTTRDMLVLRHR